MSNKTRYRISLVLFGMAIGFALEPANHVAALILAGAVLLPTASAYRDGR